MRHNFNFPIALVVLIQILEASNYRVRHNEELLGPLPSLEVPNDEFGRAARRGKVDVLGLILKKRIAKLRQAGEAELVFLVDSSASVGSDNFYNEIKFIRKVGAFPCCSNSEFCASQIKNCIWQLLADFTVSPNSTRVVVITYSSVDRVLRQVDHITSSIRIQNPSTEDGINKCRLLDSEIPSITYNSGGTYTLGALQQAIEVLEFSRKKAARAIFLITDGYSNGGDPRPAAQLLKSLNVEIFTFGIRNGNVKELKDMASEPKEEHSFILDSFLEFEALARRALHEGQLYKEKKKLCFSIGHNFIYHFLLKRERLFYYTPYIADLSVGVYLAQSDAEACNNLCEKRRLHSTKLANPTESCCDPIAQCSCGTHTGHYACVCPKGHFGQGFVGDCKRQLFLRSSINVTK